ncbi:hypothetical protein [Luteibacter sp.]|uniref:hypothetical protein n=1 Tax=Luteibacter sp. TaxID=1886636 RepID=UPI003F806654
MKCLPVAAAALLLAACGGKSMIEADATRMVAASPDSPWLTVENKGATVITVKGLDAKALVQVSPDVVGVIQAQLRTTLQPKYFTDLIIGCRNVDVAVVATPQADVPGTAIDLQADCRIVARGKIVAKSYRVSQALPLNAAQPRFDTQVPALLQAAAKDLANQLWTDVVATGVQR